MKDMHISKEFWKENPTFMSKVFEMVDKYDDVINLSIGDPDILTYSKVIDLAAEDAHNGYTKYANFQGDPELRAEIRKY